MLSSVIMLLLPSTENYVGRSASIWLINTMMIWQHDSLALFLNDADMMLVAAHIANTVDTHTHW